MVYASHLLVKTQSGMIFVLQVFMLISGYVSQRNQVISRASTRAAVESSPVVSGEQTELSDVPLCE